MLDFAKKAAYKGAGLVLNTGLGQAAVRWAVKPKLMEHIKKGKTEFKENLVKAKSEIVKSEPGLLKKVPEFKKLANSFIDQLDTVADDLTIDANIDLVINILCSHFGDFDSIEKIGEEMDKLLKDDIQALAEELKDKLTAPETGVFDIELFKEINADFDKLSNIANVSEQEQQNAAKLVHDGLLLKKIKKVRADLTDEKIEEVIDSVKVLLNTAFDKLKFTKEEKSKLEDVIDTILNDHLDDFKAKVDKLIKIAPKILSHHLEEELNKKSIPNVSTSRTEGPKKKAPPKKRAKAESEDEDLERSLELSAKEHKTAITHAKKHKTSTAKGLAKEKVVIDLESEEELSDKEEKKPVKKRGPGASRKK
ncbi:MAG: hypothetical protein HYX61_07025 [Gammaproteobacteria bacterium]|jgi:hypothetical protein|nr:hypothetical protein [Gammaproteobacteria bacterium]